MEKRLAEVEDQRQRLEIEVQAARQAQREAEAALAKTGQAAAGKNGVENGNPASADDH